MSKMNRVQGNIKDKEVDQIQNQITFVRILQQKVKDLLEKCQDQDLTKEELQEIKQQFKLLHSKSQQIIILLQVLMKLNNEVALARLDLERAVKLDEKVEPTQRRLKWLEKRLKNFLFMSKAMCHVDYQGRLSENKEAKINAADLSKTFVESLTDGQKQRLFWNEDEENSKDKETFMNTKEQIEETVEKIFSLTTLCDDVSVSSDTEEKIEDYIADDGQNGVDISDFKDGPQNSTLSQESMASSMVDDYWNSDHHRFEWTNFMQKQDPLSWHALAISYPDTFLKRGMNKFQSNEIPWRLDRDLSEGSAFTKKSIEQVYKKLQSLLQAIEDAAVDSVRLETVEETPVPQPRSVRGRRDFKKAVSNLNVNAENLPPVSPTRSLDYYDERANKLFSRPVSVVLPVVNKIRSKQFPRGPKHWCDLDKVDIPRHSSYLRGPKQALKEVPTISKKKHLSALNSRNDESCVSLRKAATRIRALTRMMPSREAHHDQDDLKWKRVLNLLGKNGIQSEFQETAKDAFKALSRLGEQDPVIIKTVREKVKEEENSGVLYEACKCLVSLGTWDESCVKVLKEGLCTENKNLQLDILETLSTARNAQFVAKESKEIKKLIYTLTILASSSDKDIAFGASLSLGHLCVADSAARSHLYTRLEDPSFNIRDKALKALVRQMNCRDSIIIESLLFQISNAKNWKLRIAAAELLQYIGVGDATKDDPEKVFDSLEKLLWNHPSQDLRTKAAEVINDFGMRPKAIFLVHKRLDDLSESIRSNAVQMLSSLRMKGEKDLKILLDILELDSSVNVRIQVLHAFDVLKWNDPRILRALREREKGDGILAKEAVRILGILSQSTLNNVAEKRTLKDT